PERAELHKSMFAVTGRYRIDDSNLLVAVDVSWNESWNGTELKRRVRQEGDKLYVETAPTPSPLSPSKILVANVAFERREVTGPKLDQRVATSACRQCK